MLGVLQIGISRTAFMGVQSIDLLRSSIKTDAAQAGARSIPVEPSAASESARQPPDAPSPENGGAESAGSGEIVSHSAGASAVATERHEPSRFPNRYWMQPAFGAQLYSWER